jgi:beta-glucanase (GH16 family)
VARFARSTLIPAAVLALLALATMPPPSPASASAGRSECGAKELRTKNGKWRCTFADDFDGTTIDTGKWVAQRTDTTGYTSGQTACFMASPNNIAVSDGRLRLTAREEPEPFTCADPYGDFETRYTSGMVSTAEGRFSQTYGRFQFRARLSSADVGGLHTALWLWPVDPSRYGPYPGSGEIDVAEMYSAYPDRAIPYIHYQSAAPDPKVTNTSCMIDDLADFHTYTLVWKRTRIRIAYDGETCLVDEWDPASPLAPPEPFDQPFYLVMTQALGVGTNEFKVASTPLPATTEIDYVRAWEFERRG